MMNKKIISLMAAVFCLVCLNASLALAYTMPQVSEMTVNGEKVSLPRAPFIEKDITMVPMRVIFEALQAKVDYNDKTQVITAERQETTIVLTLGSTIATKNGQSFQVGVTTKEYDGHTMVPLRFVSEALGANVDWQEDTQTILITLADREIKIVLGKDSHAQQQQTQQIQNNTRGSSGVPGPENNWDGYGSERAQAEAKYKFNGWKVVSEEEFNEALSNGATGRSEMLSDYSYVYAIRQ